MSIENVAAFWRQVQDDPTLRARIAQLPAGTSEEAVAGLVGLGAELGCPFSAEEFGQTAMVEGAELSDRDLEKVAGGLLSDRFTSQLSLRFSTFSIKPTLFGGGF